MSQAFQNFDDPELRRLARVKKAHAAPIPAMGPELINFFKQGIQKRQTKFGAIADCWSQLIPQTLLGHTALESFHLGQLTVLVDTSAHLYELRQLLLAGLQKQLLLACKSAGLRKISLKAGRWYDGDGDSRKVRF